MKIDQLNIGSLGTGGLDRASLEKAYGVGKPERQSEGKPSAQQTGEDRISLSELSHRLRLDQPDSPERVARLQQLSADVQAGRYKVDAGELSRLLVNEALQSGF